MVHPLSLILLLMMPAQLATYDLNNTEYSMTLSADSTDTLYTTSAPLTHTISKTTETEDRPKNVVVSGPSGGIAEGGSVTLTCSSDANPPVESYTWFKRSGTEDIKIGTGQNYTITHTSVEDSHKYKCRASNRHGSAFSESTALDILYGPKRVSSRPSSEILEGGSVTLICSSEANPPVKSYTWFKRSGKEDSQTGYGQNYSIRDVSIEDNYKYKCRASNQHGSAFSEYTKLHILYSPKKTSVSMTLKCNADANPLVMDYIWYKEGERAPVAYGQTYSIASITKEGIAPFYCKARNRIGHHFARPVLVTCIEVCPKVKTAAAVIGGFCGGLAVVAVLNILWISKRNKQITNGSERGADESKKNQTTSGNDHSKAERKRRKKKTAIEDDYENVGPESNTCNNSYTAVNLRTKYSADVYEAQTTKSSAMMQV
ncbi:carcinoembryonic antigen-related cell adhesion molecule 5-like [Pygocentrus nattereri]|uniref:carcinoembryonic antigen-related cell adhesion molecule 5-like n=1 Tax=Pygocentrus nattereri TaxID=42514 RepID=UPI001891BEA0|nr:carcinoembryonic antigen-related cell adhesion molecule 5-like [Pygocentrus nattereri]